MSKIQDYAVIGNTRTAALVSNQGSIDWLCLPRFDSPSCFACLLDSEKGGFWKIAPTETFSVKRSYIENTNVLQTEFQTDHGRLVLTDFMPLCPKENQNLEPEQEIVRIVHCSEGVVELDMQFCPRPGYGLASIKFKDSNMGLRVTGKGLFLLHTPVKFDVAGNKAFAKIALKANEKLFFSFTHHLNDPALLTPLAEEIFSEKLERTINWWQKWCEKIDYQGPYRSSVVRSALTLKLHSFSPSGAYIASPTTSLPEKLGGSLNWDYRYCWLRDASFISRALYGLKYYEEAKSFIEWILYSTKLSLKKLKVLYDVYGRFCGHETFLKHFKGYENSYPVRIENSAAKQFQLDIYGETINAFFLYIKNGGKVNHSLIRDLKVFGKFVCKSWNTPDRGIWESRAKNMRHTYSLLMCWVALDRLLQLKEIMKLNKKWEKNFLEHKEKIASFIKTEGWNDSLKSYVTAIGENMTGVSLLNMVVNGFEEADSERMKGTFQNIQKKLQKGPNLFLRSEHSIQKGEGSFQLANFWVVEYLAYGGGTLEEAKKAFEIALGYGNDLGLYSEEIDYQTLDALGNFPQGISHVGLINAALAIAEREKKEAK